MQIFIKLLLITGILFLTSSCATIVGHSRYPVSIDSSPRGALVTITDRHSAQVFSGKTPTAVRLKSSAGFFLRAQYKVDINKPGYAQRTILLTATLNGWYLGNILLGGFGLLGGLIVDPATGAMYRLNMLDVNETLQPNTGTTSTTTAPGLRIYDVSDIPASWKEKMQEIK